MGAHMDNYTNLYQNNGFLGFIRDGKIFNSTGQQVGYISEEYNKAVQVAKDYEKVLYEKGILTKPKTPEEINQELQNTLVQMQSTMVALANKIEKLEGGKDEQTGSNESCVEISGAGKDPEIG